MVTIYTIWVQLPIVVVLTFISLTFLVFLFSSPLLYSLFLALFALIVVFHSVMNYSIIRLLGAVLLLVYLGSIIILIAYVCAVVPNLRYPSFTGGLWQRGFIILTAVLFSVGFNFIGFFPPEFIFPSIRLPTFLYRVFGLLFFGIITLLILVVIYCCSLFTLIGSPFRSN